MIDSIVSLALPNANANNNTANTLIATDGYGQTEPPFDNKWRLAYINVQVPALADNTNTSVTTLLTLQHSSDGANFANTQPLVQVQIPGVASTGSAAFNTYVPLVPGIKPYIRFNQLVPTNGTSGNAVVNYALVV
jgi:hypothetical protein